MPGWVVDIFGHIIFWIGIPALFIFSAVAPFLFIKKVLRRKFNFINIVLSTLVAIGLVTLDCYGFVMYLSFLQGLAFCGIYGC